MQNANSESTSTEWKFKMPNSESSFTETKFKLSNSESSFNETKSDLRNQESCFTYQNPMSQTLARSASFSDLVYYQLAVSHNSAVSARGIHCPISPVTSYAASLIHRTPQPRCLRPIGIVSNSACAKKCRIARRILDLDFRLSDFDSSLEVGQIGRPHVSESWPNFIFSSDDRASG